MKIVLQYLFYPLTIFGTLWISFILIQRVPESYIILVPLAIVPPLLILFVFLERFMPYKKKWNISHGDFITDLLQTFITLPFAMQLSQFFLPFLLYIPHKWLSKTIQPGYLESNYTPLWTFVIALLLSELCYYWMHRLSHTVPKLWKLHTIHHTSKRIYWANSGRFHFLDALLGSTAYLLPLFLLNASDKLVIMVIVFSGVTGFLEHVNIKFKAGYLNYIFNSAELHRWHHSEIEKESNHNFGKALIVWDILFGTFLWPRKKDIGNVGVQNTQDPIGFKNQFLFPFRRSSKNRTRKN